LRFEAGRRRPRGQELVQKRIGIALDIDSLLDGPIAMELVAYAPHLHPQSSTSSTPCSRRATSCKNAARWEGASGAASSRKSASCWSVRRSAFMSAARPLGAPRRSRWPARRHARSARPSARADRAARCLPARHRARMARWRVGYARRTAAHGACGTARGETHCRRSPA